MNEATMNVQDAMVSEALGQFQATLQAAVREVHVDVSAFKQRIEHRIEELCISHGPLAGVVTQLQEENLQLRAKMEALSRLVEGLAGVKIDRSPAEEEGKNLEDGMVNGHAPIPSKLQDDQQLNSVGSENSQSSQSTLTFPEPSGSIGGLNHASAAAAAAATGRAPALPPWRAKRHAEINVTAVATKPAQSPAPVPKTAEAPTRDEGGFPFTRGSGASGVKEQRSQVSTEQSGSVSHPLLTAVTRSSSETSAASKSDPSPASALTPSIPESPTIKRGEYLFKRDVSQPKPQLPVSAMTTQNTESSSSATTAQSSSQDPAVKPGEYPFKRVPVLKTPSPSLKRSVSFPQPAEKLLPSKSIIKSSFSPNLEKKANKAGVEFNLDVMKAQTLPRANSAQAKRALFERMNSEPTKAKDSKPKLKRSQSFGVSSASGIKQILLEWCRSKTIGYQNIDIQNFSSSWSDGMAFCALVHSFFPLEFDYNALNPANRRQNLQQAFTTAEQQADCLRLIEVEDMLNMGDKPDPMCVFTYVQSLYNHLKTFE
ncbi:smoothelin-like protein 2 [Tautogolabrus adspersus]